MATNDDSNTKAFISPEELERNYLRRLVFRYLPRLTDEQKAILTENSTEILGVRIDFSDERLMGLPAQPPLHVRGDPGVGKTQIPEDACRRFCEILGFNFVKNPPDGWLPRKNDFLYTVIDMSGKSNLSDIVGMITKQKIYDPKENRSDDDDAYFGDREVYVSQLLPSKQIALAQMASMGMIVLDDIGNLPQGIRNVFLQLALNGTVTGVADLRNIEISMTSNNKVAFGNTRNLNVQSESSIAEQTRTANVDLISSPESWIRYIDKKYGPRDCHMASFIAAYGNEKGIFSPDPEIPLSKVSGIPTPRTMEQALKTITLFYVIADISNQSITNFLQKINEELKRIIGNAAADRYTSHVRAVESEALPMARDLIDKGIFDTEKFFSKTDRLHGTGIDTMYRFAYSLAEVASNRINKIPADSETRLSDIKNIFARYCKGLAVLDPSIMNASLARFKALIENGNVHSFKTNGVSKISLDVVDAMAETIGANIRLFEDQQKAIDNFRAVMAGVSLAPFSSRHRKVQKQ